jgi:hypothetical protein
MAPPNDGCSMFLRDLDELRKYARGRGRCQLTIAAGRRARRARRLHDGKQAHGGNLYNRKDARKLRIFPTSRRGRRYSFLEVQGHSHQMGNRASFEFAHDRGAVMLRGSGGNVQSSRDDLGGKALDQQVENFVLALRQEFAA